MMHEDNLSQPTVHYRKDYRPPDHLVDTIELRFILGEEFTMVQSKIAMKPNPDIETHTRPLVLAGSEMELCGVKINGEQVAESNFRVDDESLSIDVPQEAFTLEIENKIKPQENTRLMGLYRSSNTFCTQCESDGFRRITYYLDRPDVMARFTVYIEAEKARYPLLLSNGNRVDSGDLENGQHWAKWEDPHPKPSYLFALVAGDLEQISDSYTTTSGRKVKLDIFTEHGQGDKCLHAMESLKASMKWDEDTFGLECDLDNYMVVAVHDFNMGAMENKGLNVFNTKYVFADPKTATDNDYLGVEGVIGHEYFHNWTGNRVTVRDWFQLTLKEGLTVFRDQQFSGDQNSKTVQRIQNVRTLRAAQFPEDAGPMSHPIRPDSYIEMNNFYTSTVYNKGAEVIRMIHTLVGVEGFRKGMDLYFERHDGSAIGCDEFVAAMADANHIDLKQFMRWYSQAGTPELHLLTHYDAGAKTFTLTLRQSCDATAGQENKRPFHIPVAMALLGQDGKEIPLYIEGGAQGDLNTVLELKTEEAKFVFEKIEDEPVPSILRDFSAPVRLKQEQNKAEQTFLMANDPNEFNRWEAGQIRATELLLGMVHDRANGKEMSVDDGFIQAIKAILDDAKLDKSLAALALVLPGVSVLAEEMDVVDIDGIQAAREMLRQSIAEKLSDTLQNVYQANQSTEAYRCDPISVGRRSLKNACLSYLSLLNTDASTSLCVTQFENANNMSDGLAALACLVDVEGPAREKALSAFHKTWKHEALVLDKWFMLQALSRRTETLDKVEGLLNHEDFSLKNPNRCRSLISSFCAGNLFHFHRADGRGYKFLADQVIALDAMNPQIAARLVRCFDRWKKFDDGRMKHAKAQLERILAKPQLSKDVHEIVSKNLA
jgi:aminopeptidase N